MRNRLQYILSYFLFWIAAFFFLRAAFIIYNHTLFSEVSYLEIFKSFVYGLKLDLSFASYICLLPFFMVSISFFLNKEMFIKRAILIYTLTLIILLSFLSTTDLELYKWWGFRLDATVLKYLSTPREMMASAGAAPVFLLVFLWIFVSAVLYVLYMKMLYPPNRIFEKNSWLMSGLGTLLVWVIIVSLIIPIRGGFQLAPMNQSAVYFSTDPLLNNTAINLPWNFAQSILEKNYDDKNPFIWQDTAQVNRIIKTLYKETGKSQKILKDKPNVVLIIWESFTAKVVKELGGKEHVTPEFSKLIKEGILFSNIYASGDRSDKGLAAILSGYPAQPITSIITNPAKAHRLPAISSELKSQHYNTSFYYGGEPEFANIKSYLLNHHYDKLITKSDFEEKYWNSKWGAHDEIVMDRLLSDLNTEKQPFFSTIFTLSSHEPFEIPIPPRFQAGDDRQIMFMNSLYYTDQCLGKFIAKAKKTSWWNNTIVIIIADHGHPYPSEAGVPLHMPDEFRIPMLWLGGALKTISTTNSKIGSQTDLANTLLHQMDIYSPKFPFSKDMLSNQSLPFAYYAFNNGFGYINPDGQLVIDNVSGKPLFQKGNTTEKDLMEGKAYLQYSFQDYLNK